VILIGSPSSPVRSAAQPGRRHQKLHETESRCDISQERPSGICDVPTFIFKRNFVRRVARVWDMARTCRTSKCQVTCPVVFRAMLFTEINSDDLKLISHASVTHRTTRRGVTSVKLLDTPRLNLVEPPLQSERSRNCR